MVALRGFSVRTGAKKAGYPGRNDAGRRDRKTRFFCFERSVRRPERFLGEGRRLLVDLLAEGGRVRRGIIWFLGTLALAGAILLALAGICREPPEGGGRCRPISAAGRARDLGEEKRSAEPAQGP